jgi:hypothetical protein
VHSWQEVDMATIKHEMIGAWLVAGALIAGLAGFQWVPASTHAALPHGADIGRPGASVVLHETAARERDEGHAHEAMHRSPLGTDAAAATTRPKTPPEPGV